MSAHRVRQLIDHSGLSQAEFAAKAGLDASKMSKSLSGVRRFTSLDLARVAEVGGVTVDWLLGSDSPAPSLAARISGISGGSTSNALWEASRLAQIRSDLAFLGYSQEYSTVPVPIGVDRWIAQGNILAERALEIVAGSEYRTFATRDIAELIENVFGFDVAIVDLPDGFDGLAWLDAEAQLIVAGASKIPARQRFTIAHELGHLLFKDSQDVVVDVNIYDYDHRKQASEIRANAFATAFLLPEETLRTETSGATWSEPFFAELACRFWVSPSTLAWRLHNLRIIDRPTCESFRKMTAAEAATFAGCMGSLAEWINVTSRSRVPVPLMRAAFQAYADGKATLRLFANLIGVDTTTLRRAIIEERENPLIAS